MGKETADDKGGRGKEWNGGGIHPKSRHNQGTSSVHGKAWKLLLNGSPSTCLYVLATGCPGFVQKGGRRFERF